MLALALLLLLDDPTPIPVEVPNRSAPVVYEEISDILFAKCVGCHDSASAKGKLVLEDRAGMLRGGKSGPAVEPGRADESLILRRASHREAPSMPPDPDPSGIAVGPMTPEELGLLKLWIDAGAPDSVAAPEASPAPLGTLPEGLRPIVAVDVTPDGRLVAAGRGGRVIVVESNTGRVVADLGGHHDIIQSVRFAPDGSRLAAGSYGLVTVWNVPALVEADVEVEADPPPWPDPTILSPLLGRVTALDFAPDGSKLAAGSGEPGRSGAVSVWDPGSGALLQRLDDLHADAVLGLRYSPDGSKIATGSADRLAKVLDAEGSALRTLEGHEGHVTAVAWSPDGSRVLTAGDDGVLKLWNAETGDVILNGPPLGAPASAAFWPSNGGRSSLAVAAGPLGVRLLGVRSLVLSKALDGPIGYAQAVASSADGTIVAGGGESGTLAIWRGSGPEPAQVIGPDRD